MASAPEKGALTVLDEFFEAEGYVARGEWQMGGGRWVGHFTAPNGRPVVVVGYPGRGRAGFDVFVQAIDSVSVDATIDALRAYGARESHAAPAR